MYVEQHQRARGTRPCQQWPHHPCVAHYPPIHRSTPGHCCLDMAANRGPATLDMALISALTMILLRARARMVALDEHQLRHRREALLERLEDLTHEARGAMERWLQSHWDRLVNRYGKRKAQQVLLAALLIVSVVCGPLSLIGTLHVISSFGQSAGNPNLFPSSLECHLQGPASTTATDHAAHQTHLLGQSPASNGARAYGQGSQPHLARCFSSNEARHSTAHGRARRPHSPAAMHSLRLTCLLTLLPPTTWRMPMAASRSASRRSPQPRALTLAAKALCLAGLLRHPSRPWPWHPLAKQGLRKPVTFKFHYGKGESALDLGHVVAIVMETLPDGVALAPVASSSPATPAADATPAPTTPGTRANSSFGKFDKKLMTLDATNQVLSASMSLGSPSTTMSFDTDSTVAGLPNADPLNADLNAGALTAQYPIEVPAGPGGLTPPIALAYDSDAVDSQHNPQAAAGWVGEGWALSLGSISWFSQRQRQLPVGESRLQWHLLARQLGAQRCVWHQR